MMREFKPMVIVVDGTGINRLLEAKTLLLDGVVECEFPKYGFLSRVIGRSDVVRSVRAKPYLADFEGTVGRRENDCVAKHFLATVNDPTSATRREGGVDCNR